MTLIEELNRAAAAHGKLPPEFQTLSEDWTLYMQRFYPVWTKLGPRLSNPGHIELRSRTIYLDSEELLGSIEQIRAGQLDRRAIVRTFGVAFHETFHAKHSKLWINTLDHKLLTSDDPAERQLGEDRRLIEEPRIEAHGIREHPAHTQSGRFVRVALEACVLDVILPRFAKQIAQTVMAGQPVTRELGGWTMTYLQARTHYGVLQPSSLAALERIWRAVLGDADYKRLDDFYARLIWTPDGDNQALTDMAIEYRDIIGPPPPQHGGGGAGAQRQGQGGGAGQSGDGQGQGTGGQGEGAGGDEGAGGGAGKADGTGDGGGSGSGSGADGDDQAEGSGTGTGGDDGQTAGGASGDGDGGWGETPDVGSLTDALEGAMQEGRAAQLEQLDHDVDLQSTLDNATDTSKLDKGGGTGAPTGRMPDRGVDRLPAGDEVQLANRLAQKLLQALTLGTRRIDKRTPGGRFDGRAYTQGRFARQRGLPAGRGAWTIEKNVTAPIEEPHIALVFDTSGSMCSYEYALGPICWILTTAFRAIGGKVVSALFGNGAELLDDATGPMKLVPGIRTGGGTAFGGDAIVMAGEHLELHNQQRPRAIYVISDGGWHDTENGVQKIREYADLGVPTLHIHIGCEPLSVQATRVSVINDPADVLDIVAEDTLAALRAQSQRRPVTAP